MLYGFTADLVVLLHLGFILFVLFGGGLVLVWRRAIWVHVPAVVWGCLIEFSGWYCPLTPLEQSLRLAAGEVGYSGGFVEHYIVGLIYPSGLTREIQILLGCVVLIVNVSVYLFVWRKRKRCSL
jgi:hypothetical protein